MRTKVLSLAELGKGNPRNCLSARRVMSRCHECNSYLRCESKIVNWRFERLIKRKEKLTEEYMENMNEITREIEGL